ncbi:IQ-domain [Castilleja foliolosa]|uniref:IQ-domain n=1 Tax=Castilleja foliolosa TaxID=1961234 RepID=A0ABD3C945_9LAMI
MDFDREVEENIKIVEMDLGDYNPVIKARNSYSNHTHIDRTPNKQDNQQISPSPSAITDISPRTCSNHFEDYTYGTAQSSPQCYSVMSKPGPERIPFPYPRSEYAESLCNEYQFYPSYMANTQSSRAKARSHSAPKQRPVETVKQQPSVRRRPSLEGRNVPRAVRMQRSSSHVGSAAQNYQYPWSVKLDRSAVSLKDSECGSTSTVLTNANYCRSLVGFDVQGARY